MSARPRRLGLPFRWRQFVSDFRAAHFVDEGCELPWWAGVAWRDHMRAGSIVMPLGIAKLAGLLRRAWFWAIQPIPPGEFEQHRLVLSHARRRLEECEALISTLAREKEGWRNTAEALQEHLQEAHGCYSLVIEPPGRRGSIH